MAIRDTLQKPWMGGVVVALILGIAAFMYVRGRSGAGPETAERLAQRITIKDSVTGEEWTMVRGKLISALRGASANGALDPKNGVINPKTGKATGFPVDRDEWDDLIEQLNAEREAYNKSRGISKPGS